MFALVSRSARSSGGKLRKVASTSCPSCCRPVETTRSCSSSLKTSSWRCRSHTQSELRLPSWAWDIKSSAETKNRGDCTKRHPPTRTSLNNPSQTMGYFLARGLIGLDSQSNCSKASSVVSMGLVSAFSSILLFYPSAFMFIENFSQQQLLSKSCYALERGSIKLLRLIPIITIKNWVLWLDVFSDMQTQMHTEIPQRHYTRYVESISQSLDTLISLPYPPPPKKTWHLSAPYPASAGPKLWQQLGTGRDHYEHLIITRD